MAALKSIFDIERSCSLACYAMKIVTDFDLGLLESRDEDILFSETSTGHNIPETLNLQQHCCDHRLHKHDLLLRYGYCGFMGVRFLIFNIRM